MIENFKPISDSKPWYQQFWPWFIIALPASSVIAGIITLIIAINHADSIVVDNYYQNGLAINRNLEKRDRAKKLGLSAHLSINKNDLAMRLKGSEEQPLVLDFRHATQAEKDFFLPLKRRPNGSYFSVLPDEIKGKWLITLKPIDADWELVGTWILPDSKKRVLK